MSAIAATPTKPGERIVALDVLRGAAVLGILVINIQSFSMSFAAYQNPTAGWFGGVDTWTWAVSYLVADQKMMTIFAILFGAGIVLVSERAAARGASPAGLHYRRQLTLLIIGLAHAYALWLGDILVTYALCAMWVFWLRRLRPLPLIVIGTSLVLVASLISLAAQASMPFWPPDAVADSASRWSPPADVVASEIAAYRGGWWEQMRARVPGALTLQTFVFGVWGFWRASGLFLIGMALFKLGVLTAERPDHFYRRLAAVTLPLGYAVVLYGILENLRAGFAFEYSMFLGAQFNYWGSIPVSLGYIGLIMLACRRHWLPGIQQRLAACGRMALTNYLGQTVLCTFVFYGHGLGLFGAVNRPGQLGVVLAVWVFQLRSGRVAVALDDLPPMAASPGRRLSASPATAGPRGEMPAGIADRLLRGESDATTAGGWA